MDAHGTPALERYLLDEHAGFPGDHRLGRPAALDALEAFEPEAESLALIFAPQYTAIFAPFAPLFKKAVQAVDVVAKDEGKPLSATITDVMNTLTPGAPNAPALVGTPAAAAAAE